jgi:pimeloyl-ACP methyl ester carboxylesterase
MSLSTSPRLGDVTTRRPATRLRRLLAAVGVITTLVLISTVANALVTAAEKSSLPSYGQTVSLEAGDVNVVRSGGSGPTMVLLSGYGTPAPAVDFAPLIRELDDFDVIVIEGFGYGYSDLDVPERSVENITEELHEVLRQLDIDSPVILVGHSAGGLYARYYATTYPGEVSAIIGIDPMAATTASTEVGTPSVTEGVQRTLGLYRWVTGIVPELIQPPGDAYTPAERVQIAALSNWNYGNASLADEWSRLEATSTTVGQRPFPADIPVLEFLSSDSIASIPDWLTNHEDELVGVTTHRLEVLEGAHYLHWTQSPALATTISEFLAANLPQ